MLFNHIQLTRRTEKLYVTKLENEKTKKFAFAIPLSTTDPAQYSIVQELDSIVILFIIVTFVPIENWVFM